MAVKPNLKYKASVQGASLMASAQKGTPGICIAFETDDGFIEHTLWLTPKTIDNAERDLITLGADKEKLVSMAYLENIGNVITGHECEITTFEEEYNGKKRVKVQWINPVKASPAGPSLASQAALLFRGNSGVVVPDDDVPF